MEKNTQAKIKCFGFKCKIRRVRTITIIILEIPEIIKKNKKPMYKYWDAFSNHHICFSLFVYALIFIYVGLFDSSE